MTDKLFDVDRIFMTVYSGSKSEVAKRYNYSEDNVRNFRSLKSLPDLKLPSVDLNLLLIYINSENNKIITSNEKKILNLLILGDKESVDPDKALTCDPNKDKILYSYFEGLKKKKDQKGKSMAVPYLPGRSVARYQIWELGKNYGYTTGKINRALKSLTERKLIECFSMNESSQNKHDRFKLSVDGCTEYLKTKTNLHDI